MTCVHPAGFAEMQAIDPCNNVLICNLKSKLTFWMVQTHAVVGKDELLVCSDSSSIIGILGKDCVRLAALA